MPKKRLSAKQLVTLLRQIDVPMAQDTSTPAQQDYVLCCFALRTWRDDAMTSSYSPDQYVRNLRTITAEEH